MALDRAQQAADTLEQALRELEHSVGLPLLVGPVAEDPRLLEHGVRLGIEPALLGEIERQAATRRPWSGVPQPGGLEIVARNELPRLEARLFGHFVLHRDGQLLEAGPRKVDR